MLPKVETQSPIFPQTALERDLRSQVEHHSGEVMRLKERAEAFKAGGMAPPDDLLAELGGWEVALGVARKMLDEYLHQRMLEAERTSLVGDRGQAAAVAKLNPQAEAKLKRLTPQLLEMLTEYCVWRSIEVGVRPQVADPEVLLRPLVSTIRPKIADYFNEVIHDPARS